MVRVYTDCFSIYPGAFEGVSYCPRANMVRISTVNLVYQIYVVRNECLDTISKESLPLRETSINEHGKLFMYRQAVIVGQYFSNLGLTKACLIFVAIICFLLRI